MKRIIVHILLGFIFLSGHLQASELLKISRADTKDIIQVYFSFDVPPKFSTSDNKRRVDLIFSNTTRSADVSFFAPDNNIVKILPRPTKDDYILSLFFRYRPQKYKMTSSGDGKLVFEVLLGNEYSRSYQELSSRLKGLTMLDRSAPDFSNPYLLSPYKKDWMSFFSQYEAPIAMKVPVKFNAPPFPIVQLLPPGKERNLRIFDTELLEITDQGLWDYAADKLLEKILIPKDEETTKLLALSFGEVLARSGNFDDAFKQLYLLKETYKEELLGTYANYLLLNLRAIYENPHIAGYEYPSLESAISSSNPLAPYLLLSQIEAALAASEYNRLNKLLQRDDIGLPEDVAKIVRIRQADYWYAIDQPTKAYAAYRLQSETPALYTLPYSLTGYCNTLYSQKKFEQAAGCYEKLTSLVTDKNLLGLISFRQNMSKLKTSDSASLIDHFSQIENAFPDTEAGFRAAIKGNDLLILQDKNWAKFAIENYKKIAEDSISRPIREEALFKKALLHAQLGDTDQATQQLQKLLREFQTGDVRMSAQALLIDILPREIKRLVDNKEHLQALVLAKKNRLLFQNNWLDSKFLVDIAKAYHRIGIYDDAQKLYLYLIEVSPVGKREKFFRPMIQATFDHGNYSLVEDYAAQYAYNYPSGEDSERVNFIRLQALVADERLEDALQLLPSPPPQETEFLKFSASLYFRADQYEDCLNALKALGSIEPEFDPQHQFMFAESLYRTGNFNEAEDEFIAINEKNSFYEQSLFRLAELARAQGNDKKALSLLEKIVEKGKNPRWKQYAERELQFREASQRL